jgi:signal transduction histidine kinase
MMQQTEQTAGMGGAERKRVEAVVETLATLRSQGESVAEVAHDARNMVTALGLYCDLLEEPGVLANELRLVAAASRRLVEKLVSLDTHAAPGAAAPSFDVAEPERWPEAAVAGNLLERGRTERSRAAGTGRWDLMPAEPIDNLAAELLANRNLLAALAGPLVAVAVSAAGGARGVRLTGEDLTRVLVNLVKNAAEAMLAGGLIEIGLRERPVAAGTPGWLVLTIEDNGPGVPQKALEKIFESGYTTRAKGGKTTAGWPAAHRGLGLSITRSIVEAAGGRISAANRAQTGARFEIELPMRTH